MTSASNKSLARGLWRRVTHLAPKARLDALLDASDASLAVRSTPAAELFFTVMDVGLADAAQFVQLASKEQFRSFVDLGGWKKDRIDPHEVLTWLRAARGDESEPFLEKVHALDVEMLESLFRHFIVVHDLEETPDINPEGVTMESPEGKYLIEFKAEGPELAALRALLADLFAENAFETGRFLESIRWQVPSELEETAYRFRTARLSDLGFPAPEDAMGLFAYVKPGPAPAADAGLARTQGGARFVDHAIGDLEPGERENLMLELRTVSNAALVGEAVDPGDLEAVRAVGEKVRDYLSLGLEHLSGGDPAKAADVFREHPVRHVFQVGFSLTLELKFAADRLAKEPLARLGGAYLLLPFEADTVRALRQPRPLRALTVEGSEPVPFRRIEELHQTRRVLERAEAQRALFAALLGPSEASARLHLAAFSQADSVDTVELDTVLAGAVAHAVQEGVAHAEPLAAAELSSLGERLFEGTPDAPRLKAEAEQRALSVLSALVPEAAKAEVARVVKVTLENLRDELGATFLRERRFGPEVAAILPVRGL